MTFAETGRDKTAETPSSKQDRGTIAIVAGGRGCPGSALLSATAALRSGAGRVQIVTHASHAAQLAVAVPETLVLACDHRKRRWHMNEEALDTIRNADVVLVGPGLASEGPPLARDVLTMAPSRTKIVLDAAALAGVSPEPQRPDLVLLPNPDEVALVIHDPPPETTDANAVGNAAANMAGVTTSVAVVRGAVTAVADPRARVVQILDDPCPGLGVAGSGDVLAGIVAARCARASDLAEAAVWSVLVHHAAGRHLERTVGTLGFLARDICDAIPEATRLLNSQTNKSQPARVVEASNDQSAAGGSAQGRRRVQ